MLSSSIKELAHDDQSERAIVVPLTLHLFVINANNIKSSFLESINSGVSESDFFIILPFLDFSIAPAP
jgi:hypothetical protein